ncbi:hypothetical protein [[Acidovorax] ebreus]|uniref:hypothetical protein n=1 Tax=[Acidovorax] ebreus TaxID=721785 RepID=UPI0002F1A6F2|nr:hypothetical protein [[Acidovorax] ebreus]
MSHPAAHGADGRGAWLAPAALRRLSARHGHGHRRAGMRRRAARGAVQARPLHPATAAGYRAVRLAASPAAALASQR